MSLIPTSLRVKVLLILAALYLISTSESRPHIILLVADDLGWGDVSYHGSLQIPTPNLDLLARTGVVLSNYYVSPICSPSRSALLTGRHPTQTGMQHDPLLTASPEALPLEYKLLPAYLREDLNYTAHAIGKWHLGFYSRAHLPESRGFESHVGYWSGMIDYYDHTCTGNRGKYWGVDWHNGSEPALPTGEYSTEFFFRQAEDRIKNYAATHGPKNDTHPLFLYLAPTAVHGANGYAPLQVPPSYLARFRHIRNEKRRKFAGMLAALDDKVGELIHLLARVGMLDNTLIAFTSDNGAAACGVDGECIDRSIGSSMPLRGCKYTLWEGGIKVAGFLWGGPKVLPTNSSIYGNLMHISDLFATLYSAAGGNFAARFHNESLYGVDQWAAILDSGNGKPQLSPPRGELLHNIDDIDRFWAIRQGSWKLMEGTFGNGNFDNWFVPPGAELEHVPVDEYESLLDTNPLRAVLATEGRHLGAITLQDMTVNCSGPISLPEETTSCNPLWELCLFNIDTDPCERDNVACDHPDIVAALLKRIDYFRSVARHPVNRPTDPRANPARHGGYWTYYYADDD